MTSTIISSVIALLLSMLVMTLGWILSKRALMDREKSSPFECGFDPISTSRLPFSLQFFLLAIIFLIFDIEIVLLLPVLSSMSFIFSLKLMIASIIFLSILTIGLIHEWKEGSLDWIK